MYTNEERKEESQPVSADNEQRYPVEQVADTDEPSKKEVKAAVKELNPDPNSLDSRG